MVLTALQRFFFVQNRKSKTISKREVKCLQFNKDTLMDILAHKKVSLWLADNVDSDSIWICYQFLLFI